MVGKGFLHIQKRHSRRWDYFLTPKGIAEKARLTVEFIDFSMRFYHEARKASSTVCRTIAESGKNRVAFLGASDLAEIVYLGVKEWNLNLIEVFDNQATTFLGMKTLPLQEASASRADSLIVCLYDQKNPMSGQYRPDNLELAKPIYHIFPKQ
jgi:hypothetical protein